MPQKEKYLPEYCPGRIGGKIFFPFLFIKPLPQTAVYLGIQTKQLDEIEFFNTW